MSLFDNESIPRRQMTLFFLIDTSGSMAGSKIGSVNDAIENVLPMIGDISDENPDAEIRVAALEFSTSTRWLYDEPKEGKEFIWQPVEADGLTCLGEACEELEKKLHQKGGFMTSPSGCYAPAVILLSDGGPTDNFESGVTKLWANSWFKNAIRVAIAIGDDADMNVLSRFTGSVEAVIKVHNVDALKKMIRFIAVTSSQIGSKSSSATDATKQQQVVDQINKEAQDTQGAESAAAPTPSADDEWE